MEDNIIIAHCPREFHEYIQMYRGCCSYEALVSIFKDAHYLTFPLDEMEEIMHGIGIFPDHDRYARYAKEMPGCINGRPDWAFIGEDFKSDKHTSSYGNVETWHIYKASEDDVRSFIS